MTKNQRQQIQRTNRKISKNRYSGRIRQYLKMSDLGTPQGSVMSPILANIYLHEVIDKWFLENYESYKNVIVRYADDAVFFFKEKETADKFVKELFDRVRRFGLSLNEDKTRIINFDKSNKTTFDFLGFTFYWANKYATKTKILKLKTKKEALHKKIMEYEKWIKENRSRLKTYEIWKKTKEKLIGHYNYFGYYLNSHKIYQYYSEVIRSLFKWLNRRSQKISFNWDKFKTKLKYYQISRPPKTNELKQLGWSPYLC